jgi:hypothetical protein
MMDTRMPAGFNMGRFNNTTPAQTSVAPSPSGLMDKFNSIADSVPSNPAATPEDMQARSFIMDRQEAYNRYMNPQRFMPPAVPYKATQIAPAPRNGFLPGNLPSGFVPGRGPVGFIPKANPYAKG